MLHELQVIIELIISSRVMQGVLSVISFFTIALYRVTGSAILQHIIIKLKTKYLLTTRYKKSVVNLFALEKETDSLTNILAEISGLTQADHVGLWTYHNGKVSKDIGWHFRYKSMVLEYSSIDIKKKLNFYKIPISLTTKEFESIRQKGYYTQNLNELSNVPTWVHTYIKSQGFKIFIFIPYVERENIYGAISVAYRNEHELDTETLSKVKEKQIQILYSIR